MLINSMNSRKDEPFIDFIVHKIKLFFPFFVIAIIIYIAWVLCVNVFVNDLELVPAIYQSLNEFLHVFLITSEMPTLDNIWWYLSSMVFATIILFPLIRRFGENFTKVFAPLMGFMILGFICANVNSIGDHNWLYVAEQDLFRGLGEMCLGVFAYECACKLRDAGLTKVGALLVTMITLFSFAYVFINIIFFKDIDSGLSLVAFQFLIIMFMLIGTVGLMSRTTPLNIYADTGLKRGLSVILGTGSLLIYLNHYEFVQTAHQLFPGCDNSMLVAICFALTFVTSIICYYAGKYVSGNFNGWFVKS